MASQQDQSPVPEPEEEKLCLYSVTTTHVIAGLPPSVLSTQRDYVLLTPPQSDQANKLFRHYRGVFHAGEQTFPPAGLFHTAMHIPRCPYADLNTTYDITCQYLKNLHAMDVKGTHTDSDDEDGDSIFSDEDEIPPLEPVSPSTRGTPSPVVDTNTAETADPPVPEVPPMNPWSNAAGWEAYWTRIGSLPWGEGVERVWPPRDGASERAWEAAWNMRNKGEANVGIGMTDGEAVERSTHQMAEGYRHSSVESTGEEVPHKLRLIGIRGAQDVLCDCTDGEHSVYTHRQAFAFRAMDGNVVLKKFKTALVAV
ncbi:hypothetical protein DFH06DRAFT_1129609 [Mycena polygramma]|nr:hypothetical protein DFH06DRAFT_1129609 [Mycena polygramma]